MVSVSIARGTDYSNVNDRAQACSDYVPGAGIMSRRAFFIWGNRPAPTGEFRRSEIAG
jgi:hypothetical protein